MMRTDPRRDPVGAIRDAVRRGQLGEARALAWYYIDQGGEWAAVHSLNTSREVPLIDQAPCVLSEGYEFRLRIGPAERAALLPAEWTSPLTRWLGWMIARVIGDELTGKLHRDALEAALATTSYAITNGKHHHASRQSRASKKLRQLARHTVQYNVHGRPIVVKANSQKRLAGRLADLLHYGFAAVRTSIINTVKPRPQAALISPWGVSMMAAERMMARLILQGAP